MWWPLLRMPLVVVAILVLWLGLAIPLWILIGGLVAILMIMRGPSYPYVFIRTFKRDMVALSRFVKIQLLVRKCQNKNYTVPHMFGKHVKRHPNKACFIFEGRTWTFREVDEYSNRVAHAFSGAGFQPGDTVALFMDNRPEYVCIWLGLAKAGVVAALINYNLRDQPLSHCITVANSKAVICSQEFLPALLGVRDSLGKDLPIYELDAPKESNGSGAINLDLLLSKAESGPLHGGIRASFGDKMLYIYTSGTTGLPKAAVIRHSRFMFFTSGVFFMAALKNDDILYDPLPLYHTAGGMVGAGQAIVYGCTAVFRRKFSATAFWKEAIQYRCTVGQYIGETCRYLLAAPPGPQDRSHSIRVMFGNGLRPQIWEEFVKRFNIPQISEFYGATEGNANIINMEGKVGAVGFISVISPEVYPVSLIKVNEDTGEPIRNAKGLCTRCKPGETGMFVGKIVENHPVRDFHGYADPNASKKKVARDVFRKGDAYFLSGDILTMDALGYLYFKDRTGDTFRWKGENVSTSEVEAVISNVAGLKDAVVYGVEIPGAEGRAGMAAILDQDGSLNLAELAAGLAKVLPAYAQPLFVRIVKEMDLTGTYKLRKIDYQKEGFDPAIVSDQLYFLDASKRTYVPYDRVLHEQLTSGKLRV